MAWNGRVSKDVDPEIAGQAIVGAIHQAASAGFRSGRERAKIVRSLTRFLVRALEP
jgi:hypothetical protein